MIAFKHKTDVFHVACKLCDREYKIFLDEEHPIIEGKYIDDKRHGTFCGISYKNGQKTSK